MLFKKNRINKFHNLVIELSAYFLIKGKSNNVFRSQGMYFNWQIIWNSLSPLIIVAGWTFLFTIGVRGGGFDLSYFAFLLLFGIAFTQIASSAINIKNLKEFKHKKNINILNIAFATYIKELIPLIVRFLILVLILNLFNFELAYYYLMYAVIVSSLLAFFYGIFINAFFNANTFLIDAHNYFFQAIFLTSSIIMPVSRLPESIRDIILFNPLVHLHEWVKVPTTGTVYNYIDITYPIKFLFVLIILAPIFFWFINKKSL